MASVEFLQETSESALQADRVEPFSPQRVPDPLRAALYGAEDPHVWKQRDRFLRVQVAWNALTADRAGVSDRFAALADPHVIRSLARSIDCLTWFQQERLVATAIGASQEWSRAEAIAGFGLGLAALTPSLRRRLVTAAMALGSEGLRATAIGGLGAGLAALAPALRQRIVTAAMGLTHQGARASAIGGLGAGLAALAPRQHESFVASATGIADEWARAIAIGGLGAGMAALAPDLRRPLVTAAPRSPLQELARKRSEASALVWQRWCQICGRSLSSPPSTSPMSRIAPSPLEASEPD